MAVNHSETYFEEINFAEPTNATSSFAEHFANIIGLYYTPALVALGCLGNLLSIFVFFKSKLRVQSTSQYLSALAMSDTVFLCQLLVPWLKAMEMTDLFHRKGFCQAFVYTSYVSCSLSSWLVVAFTIERFVAVIYPLQRNAICTVKRARYIIFGITAFAMVLNIPLLRFAKPTENDCSVDQEYMTYAARFNLIDTIVTFSLPLSIIVILNAWIMVGVCRLERARHQLMKAEETANVQLTALGARNRPQRRLGCPRSQQRVTRMLLIVSSVFVILNLPAYIMRMMAYANNGAISGESIPSGRWSALQQVSHMLFNTNFGINFILYCLSGQNFRRALKQTIPCLRHRPRRGDAVRRVTSFHPARASSVSTSFVSNGTEATTNFGMPMTTLSRPSECSIRRRRRGEPFISRWTFDNSRQRQERMRTNVPPDHFEMRPYPGFTEI